MAKLDRELHTKYHRETYTQDEIISIIDSLNLKKYDVFKSDCDFDENNNLKGKISSEECKELTDFIDNSIKDIEKSNTYLTLIAEGKKIKQRIMDKGFASASFLFIVGGEGIE